MHCQDVSSFGNAPVKMCRLWAGSLVCVHVCVFFLFISALNALSRCVVFRQCTYQDVSSLGGEPCVCVHVCVFFLFISALNALSRCVVFRQCTCRDVSYLGGGALCVCVCLLHYLCPKCIVKMCRLLAMHLSRCVIFGQGALCVCACVCVLSFYFCPK